MKKKVKTIFLSDIHLGSIGCKSEELLEFLKRFKFENLYLVGDIIDFWKLRSKFYWTEGHSKIIKKFLDLSKKNVKIVWILGNHDEVLRDYLEYNLNFGNIEVKNEDYYHSIKKGNLWIIHGDKFDGIVKYSKFICYVGDVLYTWLLYVNHYFNKFRNIFGFKYWSLSLFLKQKTKQAMMFIYEYEKAISIECKNLGYDGVICGHIHKPEIKNINNIIYYNTGDWVESCSAIIEDYDGEIYLVFYNDVINLKDKEKNKEKESSKK